MKKSEGSPGNFINRELSWLEFNARVLEEAQDQDNPLFERLRFVSIVSSNMDEFYMVRVASLYQQVQAGFTAPDPAGLTPLEQWEKITARAHEIVKTQYTVYLNSFVPRLKAAGLGFSQGLLTTEQSEYIERYYWETIYPVLTPLVVDPSRSFPLILSRSLNIALLLENKDQEREPVFATVQVPSVLGRLVELPGKDGEKNFIFMEDIIKLYIDTIFRGHKIITMGCYRVTRNADLAEEEDDVEDLLKTIEQSLKKRKWSSVIRLEIEAEMHEDLLRVLEKEVEVPAGDIFKIPGPLDLTFLMKLSNLSGFDDLRYPPLKPQSSPALLETEDIFAAIARKDILLHHPFESFDPVVELVLRAATDPDVLAIKHTLYRVSGNSPIVEALGQAAENGKQVTVLVEVKARFDEENNIHWARSLEKAGCQVIYGLVGLKTHCKALLIVRREESGIRRYLHLGTGNYNDVTARLYTDLGLLTANPYFGADISSLFNMLSGYSQISRMYKVDIAPVGLREKFISLINREAFNARKGREARIIAKMNSLVDVEMIEALYEASTAGVEIDLIVRGICCLRPGIPGVSERIRVRSIVGRLLEHSRIYYFLNGGDALLYLSSADWMPRNLDRRVELLFPIEDEDARERIEHILQIYLRDNIKARTLNSDGTYSRVEKNVDKALNSQEYLQKLARKEVKAVQEELVEEFKPVRSY